MQVETWRDYNRALARIKAARQERVQSVLSGIEGYDTEAARDANRRRRGRLDLLIDGYLERMDEFLLLDAKRDIEDLERAVKEGSVLEEGDDFEVDLNWKCR